MNFVSSFRFSPLLSVGFQTSEPVCVHPLEDLYVMNLMPPVCDRGREWDEEDEFVLITSIIHRSVTDHLWTLCMGKNHKMCLPGLMNTSGSGIKVAQNFGYHFVVQYRHFKAIVTNNKQYGQRKTFLHELENDKRNNIINCLITHAFFN
jgi:hypothetical protein